MAASTECHRSDKIIQLINALPQATRCPEYGMHYIKRQLEKWDADYDLELNPDFQRGHVWHLDQKIAFVEAVVRGAIGKSGLTIVMNCPDFGGNPQAQDSDLNGMVCVDGLQRLTAILDYMDGKFKIFHHIDGGVDVDYFNNTAFSFKSLYIAIQIHTMQYRKDVLNYYLSINKGGTPHSTEEIERIERMVEDLNY